MNSFATGSVYLYVILFSVIIGLWLLRVSLSRRYRTVDADYTTTTAVIVPVVDEPVDLFDAVLKRITAQAPTEVMVVINGPRNTVLEDVCRANDVDYTWITKASKRHAVVAGINAVTSDIAVLVDSDTVWTEGTLSELVKPFADPTIGGVTTQQRILDPNRSVWTRWADWLERVRNSYSMPAMSVLGTVGCLPGRTIAFRRSILVKHAEEFLTDRFLGVHLEVSDDRSLTNYTLKDGYKTVYQASSLVYTDAPLEVKKLLKQQYRWSRGSQYNTLRMLGWMLRHAPVLALFYVADIVIPFLLAGMAITWGLKIAITAHGTNVYDALFTALGGTAVSIIEIIALAVITSWAFMSVRFARTLNTFSTALWLPVFMVINVVLLVPVRIWGFLRLAHQGGWGTRKDAFTAAKVGVGTRLKAMLTAAHASERAVPAMNGFIVLPYIYGVALLMSIVAIGVASIH
jgi:hyaluronan synthase